MIRIKDFDDSLGMDKFLTYESFSEDAKMFAEYYYLLYGFPMDYIVAAMTTVAACAVGKQAHIRMGEYTNYANIYMALVGYSGSNKSVPLKIAVKPLVDRDSELVERYNNVRDSVAMQNKFITKMNNKKKLLEELEPLVPQPKEYRLVITNATQEVRDKYLSNNSDTSYGLLTYYDELAGMFEQFGRYTSGRGSEITDLLSIWDNSTFSVSRKNREENTLVVHNPFMSIIGTIQNDRLARLFSQEGFTSNGFNSRWLFAMPEYQPVPFLEPMGRKPEVECWWGEYIDYLLKLKTHMHEENEIEFTGDSAAEELYTDWINHIKAKENDIPVTAASDYTRQIYAKIQKHFPKWILATHFLTDRCEQKTISRKEVEVAIDAMNYFIYTSTNVKNMVNQVVNQKMELVDRNGGISQPSQPRVNQSFLTYQEWKKAEKDGMSQKEFADTHNFSKQYVNKLIKSFE